MTPSGDRMGASRLPRWGGAGWCRHRCPGNRAEAPNPRESPVRGGGARPTGHCQHPPAPSRPPSSPQPGAKGRASSERPPPSTPPGEDALKHRGWGRSRLQGRLRSPAEWGQAETQITRPPQHGFAPQEGTSSPGGSPHGRGCRGGVGGGAKSSHPAAPGRMPAAEAAPQRAEVPRGQCQAASWHVPAPRPVPGGRILLRARCQRGAQPGGAALAGARRALSGKLAGGRGRLPGSPRLAAASRRGRGAKLGGREVPPPPLSPPQPGGHLGKGSRGPGAAPSPQRSPGAGERCAGDAGERGPGAPSSCHGDGAAPQKARGEQGQSHPPPLAGSRPQGAGSRGGRPGRGRAPRLLLLEGWLCIGGCGRAAGARCGAGCTSHSGPCPAGS